MKHLGHDLNTLPRLRPSKEKYELAEHERFAHCPVPLYNIYLLVTNDQEGPTIKLLDNITGFQVVLDNTYREFFIGGLDKRKLHLQLAAVTVKNARMRKVLRRENLQQIDQVIELIENDFLT